MDNLLWFHAFGGRKPNKPNAAQVLSVLKDALRPNPKSDVRSDEAELNISPARVYAYLGRGSTHFGQVVLTLPFNHVQGEVSPFDSGGLLKKIDPICDWSPEDKRDYLADFTWPTPQLRKRFTEYPGTKVKRYLSGGRPTEHTGPHDIWNSKFDPPIWRANASWVRWTWEGRAPSKVDLGTFIFKWTCEPEVFSEIQKIADESATAAEADLYAHLFATHVQWGAQALMEAVIDRQST